MLDNNLAEQIKSKFVTLPDEELIMTQRRHWTVTVVPSLVLFVIGIVAFSGFIWASTRFPDFLTLLIPIAFLMLTFILSIMFRSLIDWYFNIYVVTNKKILEVSYSPLSSHQINEVLLDQVKCTEIDTKIEGLLNDFLDIGHVILTFDRPTHKEAFVFEYLYKPREIEAYLHNALARPQNNPQQIIPTNPTLPSGWYNKDKNYPGKWTYTEDIANVGNLAI